jgi:hypothetical protein
VTPAIEARDQGGSTMKKLLRATGTVGVVALLAAGLSAPAATAAPASPAAPAVDKKPATVTLFTSTDEALPEKGLRLSGRVTPGVKDAKVVLQYQLIGKGWRRSQTTTTNKKGRYSFTDLPSIGGVRKYRVMAKPTPESGKGFSTEREVTVYRWWDLVSIAPREGSAVATTQRYGKFSVNGADFVKGYAGFVDQASKTYTGTADWNLTRKCTSLTTTFGVIDDADDGAVASFQLLGDGVEKFASTQALATSAPVTVDISGVFRLKYTWAVPTPAEGTTAPRVTPVMAGPEVLCAF